MIHTTGLFDQLFTITDEKVVQVKDPLSLPEETIRAIWEGGARMLLSSDVSKANYYITLDFGGWSIDKLESMYHLHIAPDNNPYYETWDEEYTYYDLDTAYQELINDSVTFMTNKLAIE